MPLDLQSRTIGAGFCLALEPITALSHLTRVFRDLKECQGRSNVIWLTAAKKQNEMGEFPSYLTYCRGRDGLLHALALAFTCHCHISHRPGSGLGWLELP